MPSSKNDMFPAMRPFYKPGKTIPAIWFLFFLKLFTSSCVPSWVLKKEDKLYTGAKIMIHTDTVISEKRQIKGQLKDNVYPLPNRKFIGLPLRMWVYQIMGQPKKKKGLRFYLKYEYGEAPVLLQSIPIEDVTKSLHQLLKANGFFDSRITASTQKAGRGNKRWRIVYHCYLKPPYHLNNISNTFTDTAILRLINQEKQKMLLHPGDRYDLNTLKNERERIDQILKRNGYFYFSKEFILYLADSISTPGKKINLTMKFKDDIDPRNLRPWHINQVWVNENTIGDTIPKDTTVVQDIVFTSRKTFKPKILRRFILFNKNALITSTNYSTTIRNLSSFDAFEFTNIDFEQNKSQNKVDIKVNIIPYKRNSFKSEVNVVSKTNNFAGPGVDLLYLNRNLLHGAEQFTVTLHGGIEAWFAKDSSQVIGRFNYEVGTSVELNVPRLLLLNSSLLSRWSVPYTSLGFDFKRINQMQFYQISIFRTSYGYKWRETENKSHILNISDISYQHVSARTARFVALAGANTLLARSFADQLMIGTNYTYQNKPPYNTSRTFSVGLTAFIESSGQLLYGLQKLAGVKKTGDSVLLFLGTPYSQYIKTFLDLRMYYSISKANKLVTRLFTGIGFPMGNSGILPNIKQFFAGGPTSLRAFRLQTIGPGTFSPPNNNISMEQTGDIRLEGNIEDRIKIANRLELALFFDAGNIWLARNDPARPGAQFHFNTFYSQLATGWGFGLRYLNPFFILRVDIGYPMHSPNTNLSKGPVYNLAIGYPF